MDGKNVTRGMSPGDMTQLTSPGSIFLGIFTANISTTMIFECCFCSTLQVEWKISCMELFSSLRKDFQDVWETLPSEKTVATFK